MNEYQSAFYDGRNYSSMPMNEMSFGDILINGIKGVTQNAMNGMVNGAYSNQQLQYPQQYQANMQMQAGGNPMTLIFIGVIAYLLLKK